MVFTSNPVATEGRQRRLASYFSNLFANDEFTCKALAECRASHGKTFYEGQLHHLGRHYDAFIDGKHVRIVIVGQEYGHGPANVPLAVRYDMIMYCAHEKRFRKCGNFENRNHQLKGTTSILRLIYGKDLGTDFEGEILGSGDKCTHLFDAFAMVNYLLCSAVRNETDRRGIATSVMKQNCLIHFRSALEILEPTVVIVQGKSFWWWVKSSFDNVVNITDNLFDGYLGTSKVKIAVFAHPSAPFYGYWGNSEESKYLVKTVAPTIQCLHSYL